MLGSDVPSGRVEMTWAIEDPETSGQFICGFSYPRPSGKFRGVQVAVCLRKELDNGQYVLDGTVKVRGLIRLSDHTFIEKKER